MASIEKQLQFILAKYEPTVAAEFRKAIADINNRVILRRVVEALKRGDIETAVDALNIEKSAFGRMLSALMDAYDGAGAIVVDGTTWKGPDLARVVVRWDMANPLAQSWISRVSTGSLVKIADEVKAGAQAAIEAGYSAGRHPNSIALDLVGRIGASGRRSGGVVGLSEPQAQFVMNMRSRLLSGDPAQLRKVLNMSRRDTRFDRTILAAIRDGRPVAPAMVDRMTGRYSDRLLALRGEMLARTETAAAVENARMDAFRQGLEKTGYPESAVMRTWIHSGIDNEDSRQQHLAMDHKQVRGLTMPFEMADGSKLMFPLDTSQGAGPGQVINCRCTMLMEIDYRHGLR